jgi:hypothetical protein
LNILVTGLLTLMLMLFAVPLVAQEAPTAPGDLFVLAGLLVAAVLPFATSWIYEGLQKVAAGLETLPKVGKVLLGVVIGYGLAWVAFWLGLPLPESIDGITEANVFAILEGLAAVGMHALRKRKTAFA